MIDDAVPMRKDIHLTREQATDILSCWMGKRVSCQGIRQLDGGVCSGVFLLEFDESPHSAVVKMIDSLEDVPENDCLLRESRRLDFLHQHTNVSCPRVYLQDRSGIAVPYSILLLERLPGINLWSANLTPDKRSHVERELAETLLELHSHKRVTFGEMEEPGVTNFVDHFMPCLLEMRTDMNDFLSSAELEVLDGALVYAEDALRVQGEPTLIHGDAWAGNIMVHERSDGWHLSGLLDPVCLHYADVDSELAHLEAFDTVYETFFEVYTSQKPLRPGYEFRRLFYWLHTYMVHVWLGHGSGFDDKVVATSKRVIDLARMI